MPDPGVKPGSVAGESGRPVVDPVEPAAEASPSGNGTATQYTHLLCVSPDAPTNPVLYWLGTFDAATTEFLLKGAKGPLRLDLGDILYAPNLLIDAQVGVSALPSLFA